MNQPAASILVIGVGNSLRHDDGLGLEAAQRLRGAAPPGVAVLENDGEGARLLDQWQGAETVVVVDATASGEPPGTIQRLDAVAAPLPAAFEHVSSHAFSVAGAVELARALGQLPRRLIVYGLEGADFSAGSGLSTAVEAAMEELLRRLRAEVGS